MQVHAGRPLLCEGVRDEWQTVATVLQLLDKLLVPFEGVGMNVKRKQR